MLDKSSKSQNSILIFDSGFGGLFFMKEVIKKIKNENIIYFADSFFCPYGEKSKKEIVKRVVFLLRCLIKKHEIKIVAFGCNTISAYIEDIKKKVKIEMFDIITPSIPKFLKESKSKKVAILATKATILSKVFERKIAKDNICYFSFPLLVSLLEKKTNDKKLIESTVKKYCEKLKKENIEAIMLSCTHYIFFKNLFKKFLKKIKIIDPIKVCVEKLKNSNFKKASLFNIGKYIFYTTKDAKTFKKIAEKILNIKIKDIYEK